MEWPSPSSPTETLSGLVQKQPKILSYPKAVDLPYFLVRAAAFIRPKSPVAARFKQCKFSFV